MSANYAMSRRFSGKRGADPVLREAVTTALSQQGFGVLTEIDVQATMKKKLDVDIPPHVILGACNPSLAHQALQAEADIGLLLPCNVVIREDGDETVVAAIDPQVMFSVVDREDVAPLAAEVKERLQAALAAIEA